MLIFPGNSSRNITHIVAAPLTRFTSISKQIPLTPTAEAAFLKLKDSFTSAPILIQPDLEKQFVAEVDTSDIRVGAVLSQHSAEDGNLRSCAFLSHHFSPSERNFDVGNHEVQAGKLALEEWQNWLEGSKQSFVEWTDQIVLHSWTSQLPHKDMQPCFLYCCVHQVGGESLSEDTEEYFPFYLQEADLHWSKFI